MTREEKYDLVNKAETPEAILNAITELAEENGDIRGRTRNFSARRMRQMADLYFQDHARPEVITREFGLRQQAMYVKYYTDRGVPLD